MPNWLSMPRKPTRPSSRTPSTSWPSSSASWRARSPTDASRQIRSAQFILIVLSIAAVIGAALVAWLYVGRSVARRIGLLSHAMRRIADGDLNVDIHDEPQR